jgi:hypothetical protein
VEVFGPKSQESFLLPNTGERKASEAFLGIVEPELTDTAKELSLRSGGLPLPLLFTKLPGGRLPENQALGVRFLETQ